MVALCDHPTMVQMPTSAPPGEIVKGVDDSSPGTPAMCLSVTSFRQRVRVLVVPMEPRHIAFVAA
jgi:hypothetical protein